MEPSPSSVVSVSSESRNQDEAQLFCQSNVVVGSGIVMLRFWSVIGGFVENLFTCSSLLLSKLLSWRGSSHPDDHGQWSSRSGPLLTFLQKNENPFPSCRYRRSNGGWCLPTSSGRGAPGTSPGALSGCGSRTWIMDNCCCNDEIVMCISSSRGLKRGSAII